LESNKKKAKYANEFEWQQQNEIPHYACMKAAEEKNLWMKALIHVWKDDRNFSLVDFVNDCSDVMTLEGQQIHLHPCDTFSFLLTVVIMNVSCDSDTCDSDIFKQTTTAWNELLCALRLIDYT
jgi:hypothetical protein